MPPAAFKSQPSRHHLAPRRYQTTATASVILRPLHCPHRPITATNEDGTSYSSGKQVTAGRHVTTESPVGYCLALIASRYSSPSPSTGKIHYHFYGKLPEIAPGCFQIATVQASPPTAPVPDNGCCVRHLRHAHCSPSRLSAANRANPGGKPSASPTLTRTLLLTTPPPPDQSVTALDTLPRHHSRHQRVRPRRDVTSASQSTTAAVAQLGGPAKTPRAVSKCQGVSTWSCHDTPSVCGHDFRRRAVAAQPERRR